MQKTTVLLLTGLLLALSLPLPLAAAEGPKMFPYPAHTVTLENGLQVILIQLSSPGLLSYWTIVRTGSRDEYEVGRTGFAHFFEHMMFRGTKKYPADAYSAITTRIGANANAFTSDDMTAYYMDVAAEDLETVLDIESDRFINLAYPLEMFKTEAGAVYGEYRKNRTQPFFALFEALQKTAFVQHTYGHTTIGFEEDIQRMPELFAYSQTFFQRHYRPENTILLIVGDLEPTRTLELVKRYYGGWQPGYLPPQIPSEPVQTAERRVDVAYPGRSLPMLWLAYKTDAFAAQDRTLLAAQLLTDLAFGPTSPLYQKLVLEQQVVERITADVSFNRDPSLINIIAWVKDPAKIDEVRSEIERTLTAAQQDLPDPKRLAALKSRLRYNFLMNLATPSDVAGALIQMLALTGRLESIDELYATYEGVTSEDLRRAAQRYFDPARRTVGILRGES